jgi:hypothetical protein
MAHQRKPDVETSLTRTPSFIPDTRTVFKVRQVFWQPKPLQTPGEHKMYAKRLQLPASFYIKSSTEFDTFCSIATKPLGLRL